VDKDYYKILGVQKVINAKGTYTYLGGSRLRPAAASAMALAGDCFLDIEDLYRKTGKYIAQLLNVEAVCVTSGAAAGLVQATAACMTGTDPNKIGHLPDPLDKSEVIILCSHRNPFDKAIRIAGAKLIEVGNAIETPTYQVENAISESTAALVYFLQAQMLNSSINLEGMIEIAHKYNLPIIVDAAAELPPKENLWAISNKGADLVIFSGGKDIGGPQASGLVVGRRDLIEAVMLQASPYEYAVARPMKASKEVMIGLVCALEEYLEQDEELRFQKWEEIYQYLERTMAQINCLAVSRFKPTQPGAQPAITPRLAVQLAFGDRLSTQKIASELLRGTPPIVVSQSTDTIYINTHTLELEEARIITDRFKQILSHYY
jgi:uncharacterized pyridoxal phosphate-dependent enzyme